MEMHFVEDMIKRKMKYAGHVLRGSSGLLHLQILEGKIEGKTKVDSPRTTRMKDMMDRYRLDRYGYI